MALTGVLIFMSTEQQLREFTFWSLGSLAGATWEKPQVLRCSSSWLWACGPLRRGLDRLALVKRKRDNMG